MGPMMKLHQNAKPSDKLEEKKVFFSVKNPKQRAGYEQHGDGAAAPPAG